MDIPDEAFASQAVRRSRLVKEMSNWEKYVSHPSRLRGPKQLTADRLGVERRMSSFSKRNWFQLNFVRVGQVAKFPKQEYLCFPRQLGTPCTVWCCLRDLPLPSMSIETIKRS